MAFSREVNDRARFMFVEQTGHQTDIANVAPNERMPPVALQAGKVVVHFLTCEFVEIDNRLVVPT